MCVCVCVYRDGQNELHSCEYAKQSLLLCYYLLIIVLSICITTINLLLPAPVYVYISISVSSRDSPFVPSAVEFQNALSWTLSFCLLFWVLGGLFQFRNLYLSVLEIFFHYFVDDFLSSIFGDISEVSIVMNS